MRSEIKRTVLLPFGNFDHVISKHTCCIRYFPKYCVGCNSHVFTDVVFSVSLQALV